MKTLYFADAALLKHRIPQAQWTRKQRRAFKMREAAKGKKTGLRSTSYRDKQSYGYTTVWMYTDIGGAGLFINVIDMWLHVTSPRTA